MKRTTRNNILRYAVATIFVSVCLLLAVLLWVCIEWLGDKTKLPVSEVFLVASFIFLVWKVGKCVTIKDKEED